MEIIKEDVLRPDGFSLEVEEGQRFEFGKNWRAFLSTLDDEKIRIAEDSIKQMLGVEDLRGKKFLDAGSGSGLFSLAARRLGATVHSFDYDPSSVACTQELYDRFFPADNAWTIERGSLLDKEFLKSLGDFDVVYSWGVMHHTGDMWTAMDNVSLLVKPDGRLFISIYNDQGYISKLWWRVKKTYCSSSLGKIGVCTVFFPYFFIRTLAVSTLKQENVFSTYKKNRGMSIIHDWYDWLGGFPFEVAKVEDIFRFYKVRGFELRNLVTTSGLGTNQMVFVKSVDV